MVRKQLELIDQYLEEMLPEQEVALFEQRLRDDIKFYAEFYRIKLIIKGICSLVMSEELSVIKQMNRFLEKGGTLLRHNIDGKGENVIEYQTIDRDWRTVLICETMDNCVKIISHLRKKYPAKFQTMEIHSGLFGQRTIIPNMLKEPVTPVVLKVKKAIANY